MVVPKHVPLWIALLGLPGIQACDPGSAGGGTRVEWIDSKGDLHGAIRMRAALKYAQPRADSFRSDFELHGFPFRASAGSSVGLTVTADLDASLEPVLYLYGPKQRGRYDARLGMNATPDEPGVIQLASPALETTGLYLAVVGTRAGDGRGGYRIALTCSGDDCEQVGDPAACPEAVANAVIACVDQERRAAADGRLAEYEAFVSCTTDLAGDVLNTVCASTDIEASPPEYCAAPLDDLFLGCAARLAERYPVPASSVDLTGMPLSSDLRGAVRRVGCDSCAVEVSAYRYAPSGASLAELLEALRLRDPAPSAWTPRADLTIEQLSERFDAAGAPDLLGAAKAMADEATLLVGALDAVPASGVADAAPATTRRAQFALRFEGGLLVTVALTTRED